jgi:hypothetical protein
MFSRKSNKPAFDLDRELLRVLDDARSAGLSSRTISGAFQSRADAERQHDAMSRPWSGHIPQQYDGYGRPIVR